MKTKIYESINETAPVGFALFTGSSGEKVEIAVRKHESVYGMLTPQQKLQMLGLDAEGVTGGLTWHRSNKFKFFADLAYKWEKDITARIGGKIRF